MKKKCECRGPRYRLFKKIMLMAKLTGLFVLIFSLHLSASVYSQNARLSLDLKEKTIKEVLQHIEADSEYRFIYENEKLNLDKTISISATDETVEEILKQLFSDESVEYTITGSKLILIKPAQEFQNQSQLNITGQVTDSNGDPLPGVTVMVKGTIMGVVTDDNGNYALSDVPADATLVFSFVGMRTQEIIVGRQRTIDIVMIGETIGIEEVVAVGYGTQKKVTLTGSVGNVKVDEIAEMPVGNITSALAGKIAGLQVINRGGQPGSDGASLNIRGLGAPLVLVDGIQQEFGNIDPNEIESISVLKDASSSIYGARAGNGVILVTTKRGTTGKPSFNLNYSTSFSTPTRIVEFADAPLYAQLVNEADITNGSQPTFSDEEIEKFRLGNDPRYPNTDWWDETFKTWAPMSDYNLNIRGGREEVNYFVSLGYLNQKSMLRSDDINFDRFSFRSNLDAKITKNFKVGIDFSGRKEYRDEPGRNINTIMTAVQAAKPTEPAHYPDLTKPTYPGYDASWANPLPISERDYSGYHSDNFQSIRGTLTLDYNFNDLVKGLSAEGKMDYRANDRFAKDWNTTFDYHIYDYDNDVYSVATAFNSGKNSLNEFFAKDWLAYGYFKLNYQRSFENHNISALALVEAQSFREDRFSGYREGFITTAIDQLFAGSDENKDSNGGANEDGRMSYVGKLGYNYKGKYMADVIFRVDGSPKFHEDRRWGFFPALSVGWRLSEESFIKDNFSSIDNLKLRASYGQAGDEGAANFNYLTGYVFGRSYIYGLDQTIEKGISSKGLANPYARWAETSTYNLGIDASFRNQLFYFEADVFYRKKEGMLATRLFATPSTFGASLPEENINSQDTRGFDAMFGHSKSLGDFRYDVKANVSWARSKWIHFEEPEYTDEEERNRRQISGQWTNMAWGYESDGLFSSQEEIDGWADITNGANNNVIKPGDIRYIDQNNDETINWKDEIVIGKSAVPEIFYGMDINVERKNIGLNMLLQGATNYSVFYSDQFIAPFGVNFVPFALWEDRWTEDNPNAQAELPRVRYGAGITHPNGFSSDFWTIRNAYYIRLKNVQLYYRLPQKLIYRSGLKEVRLFASATNLGVLTNVKYRDPESDNAAGRNYPQQKTISFGVNVKF